MGGWTNVDVNCLRGLAEGGVSGRIEIYDYTKPNWMISTVRAWDHNRAAARYIADRITAKVRAEPSAKIVLVSWSTGSAVTIWTLESLPADVKVQSVLAIQPCVNPDHDLRPALEHVRGHFFAVRSWGDFFALGLGTTLIGTADGGHHTPAAGMVGFRRPPGCDKSEYAKLVEIPYKLDYLRHGHLNGHVTAMSRTMAREVLAPMLVRDAGE